MRPARCEMWTKTWPPKRVPEIATKTGVTLQALPSSEGRGHKYSASSIFEGSRRFGIFSFFLCRGSAFRRSLHIAMNIRDFPEDAKLVQNVDPILGSVFWTPKWGPLFGPILQLPGKFLLAGIGPLKANRRQRKHTTCCNLTTSS